ncbi:uncharacterized protein METZ01_LOCUS209982 [marine metagenome]|uniref:Uncharacterized protein n=1 Tax=marine metagenome TaxID=408172 RepID=A0A382F289_9ZZZZ
MYRWLALLFLAISMTGVHAEDEIPEVVQNETAIEPQSSDDDDDDGISNETIIMAAGVLGVCIMVAAVIMRR